MICSSENRLLRMKFVSSLGRTLHHTGYPLRGRVKTLFVSIVCPFRYGCAQRRHTPAAVRLVSGCAAASYPCSPVSIVAGVIWPTLECGPTSLKHFRHASINTLASDRDRNHADESRMLRSFSQKLLVAPFCRGRTTDEFRAVVGAQMPRHTALGDESRQVLVGAARLNAPVDLDRKVFLRPQRRGRQRSTCSPDQAKCNLQTPQDLRSALYSIF